MGNTISDLTIIDQNPNDIVALIRTTGVGSVIRDINLTNVNIQGTQPGQIVAALVAGNESSIANAFVSGQVSASGAHSGVGGLVGANTGVAISHSISSASVSGSDGTLFVGGLVGMNEGFCSGSCFGRIDQSYSSGAVIGGDGTWAGGLVGYNLGGIISDSYAAGTVSGGSDAFVGGLVGTNADNPTEMAESVITRSYSFGSVSGGSGSNIGGLIGQDIASPGITDAYWDLDTSGVGDPAHGAGNVANDPGITGLTTAQFQSGLPAGFDKKVWREKAGINGGYPYLIDNPPD